MSGGERDFPPTFSDVEITFLDGEVVTVTISAGVGISDYLAREAASTGVLALHDYPQRISHCYPLAAIRNYKITERPQ